MGIYLSVAGNMHSDSHQYAKTMDAAIELHVKKKTLKSSEDMASLCRDHDWFTNDIHAIVEFQGRQPKYLETSR